MQSYSYTAIATNPTYTTYRRRTDTPGHSRHSHHGLVPTRTSVRPSAPVFTKPVQSAVSRDFHLDTFFNTVWMSGPHVFTFAMDGTIVRPDGFEPQAQPRAKPGRSVDKPWKNVAITEQDEAAMEAMEVRRRAEEKARLVGLVYTWPPEPRGGACKECEVLARPQQRVGASVAAGMGVSRGNGEEEESAVPALSYGSSGESESEGEVYRAVPERRNGVGRQDVLVEKGVGCGRSWRKASGPHSYVGTGESERESVWTRYGMAREVGKKVVNPLTTESWVEDELTIKLKAILRMPDI